MSEVAPEQFVKPAPKTLVRLANDEKVAPEVTLREEPKPTLPVVFKVESDEPPVTDNPPDKIVASVTVKEEPTPKLEENLPVPTTSRVLEGAELATPTLPPLVTTNGDESVLLT